MGRTVERTRLQTITDRLSGLTESVSNGTTSTDLNLPTEVCTGTAKTKEQSQRRAFNLIPIMVSPTTDRLVRTGTQRNSSWPGEISPPKGRIHCRRLVFSPKPFPLQ